MRKSLLALALLIAVTVVFTTIPSNSDAFFGLCKPRSCGYDYSWISGWPAYGGCGYGYGGHYGGYGWGGPGYRGYGYGRRAGGFGVPVSVGVGYYGRGNWGVGFAGGMWY
jgi:hypothetical protein